VLVASLVVFSPFMAAQAGWLRMYAPLSALVAAAVYFKIAERSTPAAVAALLAAAVHPFGAFIAIWVALWLLLDGRAGAAASVAFVPSAMALTYLAFNYFEVYAVGADLSLTNGLSYTGGTAPGLLDVLVVPVASLAGSPMTAPHVLLALIIGAVAFSSGPREGLRLLVAGSVLSIAAASHLILPVFKLKYMAVVSPVMALLLADDDRDTRQRAAVVAGMAILYSVGWVYRYSRALNIRSLVFDLPW
jgi:hypothetical protein